MVLLQASERRSGTVGPRGWADPSVAQRTDAHGEVYASMGIRPAVPCREQQRVTLARREDAGWRGGGARTARSHVGRSGVVCVCCHGRHRDDGQPASGMLPCISWPVPRSGGSAGPLSGGCETDEEGGSVECCCGRLPLATSVAANRRRVHTTTTAPPALDRRPIARIASLP